MASQVTHAVGKSCKIWTGTDR